ncbi:acyl-CoA dehydrogenase C-terminal domain-containing protein [Hyphococcus luteus]|uniref:3-methylmercaptopropionyl-CoA dehydrogenase n=1 Tax=Hyphococcus luteus TaxID=2058213 RepID=A0A2S7K9I9_9PROT|nr:acyl-CoA dehydrogenase [Marinicaulis flavus]
MTTYTAPLKDMQFVLNEVLQISKYSNLPGFSEASEDVVEAILEEGAKMASNVLHPINQSGDKEGCTRHEDGSVTTPKGFKEAYEIYKQGGWQGLSFDPDYGGQGLPYILAVAVSEMVSAANMAFGMYPGLARGAADAIHAHGTDEQKQKYLPNMIAGEWGGTMNLTEPHCGTDLGLLKTKAVPQGDGAYKITGSKIFISAGEHDLTEQIIHLVLARIEGAPEGVKGISLFIVPKYHINDDGSLGERNGVMCGSIEEKMGIHANSTCVLNYDDATGYLLGEENKGLRAMFTMMNEARLGVGLQGMAISEVAYQNGAAYAKDRLQGRALTGPEEPEKPADPIIVHPDVRRMLMDHKAFTEGARAWMYWSALYGDLQNVSEDEATRQKADDYMGLMTPVLKSYLTDRGYWHATNAQQVLGGHGYIQEWGMEQFVRDARIAMIYEGANGIQALDLVGRKLPKDGGRAVMTFFAEIDEFVKDHEGDEDMKPYVEGLAAVKADMVEATQWFMANAMQNPNNAGASSMDYLGLTALTCLAYAWAMSAKAALEKKDSSDDFYKNKLMTAKYFVDRVLPERSAHLAKIKSGSEAMMALPAEAF